MGGRPGASRARAERVDYAIGSVLLLRAEALEQVGGFDEDFFLYAEETDWAKRARTAGMAAYRRHRGDAPCTPERRRALTRPAVTCTSLPGWSATCASTMARAGWALARSGEVGARRRGREPRC
ncbi:MAG: hypothetical protein V9F04_18115 [Dermatophilaceae bacterium]